VIARTLAFCLCAAIAACSGGGGSDGASVPPSSTGGDLLTEADVKRVIAQAVGEARARGVHAQVAVVDRVGNVLGVYAMPDAPNAVLIDSGLGVSGGIETRMPAVSSSLAAISKAITGAYLSSQGNAFSTRTAGQIVQEHFNPGESQQPSGPLYGVQFSQLSCSDVNRNVSHGSVGPKRSPLGLAADPGGLPLYKNGVLVGGIGVEFDRLYGFDRNITDVDENAEEIVAVAGASGFAAPSDIRGERITADGRTFRFVDSQALRSDPSRAPEFASLPGAPLHVEGFTEGIRAGTAYGTAASGVRADSATLAASGAWILVDADDANRFAPRAATAGDLAAGEVRAILAEALAVARRARAQIRRPPRSFAQVTVAVVDLDGDILGLVRTADAPVFGIDVSVQKARTAMFFSHPAAAGELASAAPARYLESGQFSDIATYVAQMRSFLADGNALTGNTAWSARAIGNLHRPTFPDGIDGTPAGPLSKPFASWSPFNVGLQLDLVNNQLVKSAALGDVSEGCAGRKSLSAEPGAPDPSLRKVRNGLQIFPGGVPIYRGERLVGGVGVSGDGVDQDDMIAYLGLANAARALGSGLGHAPRAMRADTLTPLGTRLRYVQCPQAPFNDSSEQNVCN
jgi:uncharacterized protein GlcG (DUF336 family)